MLWKRKVRRTSTLNPVLSQVTGWTTGIQFLLGAVMGLFWG